MVVRKNFEKGDQVLLYDSKLHLFPDKLKSRWTGPFTVHEVYTNEAVELLNSKDDRVFKVNGQRLKTYAVPCCKSWKPRVPGFPGNLPLLKDPNGGG